MQTFDYPVAIISQEKELQYARFPDDIFKTNTHLLKKGFFENLILIDSKGNKFKIKEAKKNRSFGLFWGISPFGYQHIIVDLEIDKTFEKLNLEEFKNYFIPIYKKDAHLYGGIVYKDDILFINNASSIQEIINYCCELHFKEYPV